MFSVDAVAEIIKNGGKVSVPHPYPQRYNECVIKKQEGCNDRYCWHGYHSTEYEEGAREAAIKWLNFVDPIQEPNKVELPNMFVIDLKDLEECSVQKSQPVLPALSDYDAGKCLSLICQSPPGTKVSWSSENTQNEKKT